MDAVQGDRWGPGARPRLASKVRLQWNAPRQQALLLYPEGALALNPTARAILELCDGRRTVADLVSELATRFGDRPGEEAPADPRPTPTGRPPLAEPSATPGAATSAAALPAADRERLVERDVRTFLERLGRRGWLTDEAIPRCS